MGECGGGEIAVKRAERLFEDVRRGRKKERGEVSGRRGVKVSSRRREKAGYERGQPEKASLSLRERRRPAARRSACATPENRRNAANFTEGEKTRGIFPPLLFSGVLRKSIIKNAKKYNSFRRFVEYLPVSDTPLRPFPTTVGFVRRRGGTAGCVGDGAQRVRQVVVAAGCAGAGGGVRGRTE